MIVEGTTQRRPIDNGFHSYAAIRHLEITSPIGVEGVLKQADRARSFFSLEVCGSQNEIKSISKERSLKDLFMSLYFMRQKLIFFHIPMPMWRNKLIN